MKPVISGQKLGGSQPSNLPDKTPNGGVLVPETSPYRSWDWDFGIVGSSGPFDPFLQTSQFNDLLGICGLIRQKAPSKTQMNIQPQSKESSALRLPSCARGGKRPRRHAMRVAPASVESFYASHPRSLVAKRMMSGIIQLVQTKTSTTYVPQSEGSGHLIERKERISADVLAKLTSDIKRAFWVVYRFDEDTLDLAMWTWTDADLATMWGAHHDRQRIWELEAKARESVEADWKRFCWVEGME